MEKIDTGYSYVTCYKIPLEDIKLLDIATCKQPKETLSSFYGRQPIKPDILMNGGFFGLSNGYPVFNFIDEEEIKAFNTRYKYGLGVTKDGKIYQGNIETYEYKDFLSGYPCLVSHGRVSDISYGVGINTRHPRSAIGYSKTHLYMMTVDGRQPNKKGMTLFEIAELLVKLGCENAINLDGGGSTRMMVEGSVANSPTENRPVDNVIALYLKDKPEEELPKEEYTDYIFQQGDTLWGIARKYLGNGTKYIDIKRINNIEDHTSIKVGTILKIPLDQYSGPLYEVYIVKAGDTLGKIATAKLGSFNKYKDIMAYNNMHTTVIRPGELIKIPK